MQIMNTELTKNKFKRTCDDDSYALGERSEEEKKEIESSTRSSNRRSLCVGDTIIFFTLLTLFFFLVKSGIFFTKDQISDIFN